MNPLPQSHPAGFGSPGPPPPPRGTVAPQDRRLVLASLQTEAEDFGRPWLAEAFRRLALMHEVGECLESTAPEGVAELNAFNSEAYLKLTDVSTDDEHERAAAWVMEESARRWGDYLALLDPNWTETSLASSTSLRSDGAHDLGRYTLDSPQENDPALDTSALFRLLTGGLSPSPSLEDPDDWAGLAAISPKADPAPPRKAVSTPKPGPSAPPAASRPPEPPTTRRTVVPQARPPLEIPEPPQSVAIDPELRDTFLEEAGDLFERVESLVLSLVADQPQPDPLHEIGRCLHTLKGAAGSVDLTQLAMLIHGMEEHLEAAAGRPSAAVIDQLHRLLEYVEGLFHALRRGHAPAAAEPISTAVAPLPPVSVVNEPPRSAAPSPVHPNVSAVEAPGSDPRPITIPGKESASGDGPVRISSERVDALMDIASELISRRGLWSAQADAMRELATLLRTCRTRLTATIDRIRDLHVENLSDPTRTGGSHGTNDLHESIRRLTEQADDLVELIESTQAASKPLADNSDALARQTLQLWESLQAIRIVPVRGLFQRLMRVVHDAARVEGRQVEVVTVGDETGLDRAVQDKAFEPLLHVVRNAVCHGIESPEDRRRMGKPPTGRITLEASRSGNTMVLSVQDDGRGLDYDAIAEKGRRLGLIGRDDRPSDDRLSALIFQSGFSTRDAANAVAGRGVGMDVVSQEAAKLHGSVSLVSQQGKGMRLSIALPARLALEQSMVLRVDRQAFALPVELVELAEPFDPEVVDRTTGIPRIPMRNESVPLVVARDAFGFPPAALASCSKVLLIRAENQPLAVLVDSLDGTRELVIKPLGPLLSGHPLISGVSLSVTGEVIFAVNPAGLALWQREGGRAAEATGRLDHPAVPVILVVDDSISVRKVVARQLRQLGYHVEEVNDGLEALGKIRHNAYGLVISDLEMPRMDGFELLAELSRLNIATSLPVLAASTRSDPETRRRILALGAREFVAKPIDPDDLAEKVHALLRPAVAASPTARGA